MEEDKLTEKLSSIELPEVESLAFRRNLHQALLNHAQAPEFKQPGRLSLKLESMSSGFRNYFIVPKPAWQMVLLGGLITCVLGTSIGVPVYAKQIEQNRNATTPVYVFSFPPTESGLTLDQLKQKMGRLWIPGYIPPGYVFKSASATVGYDAFIQYQFKNSSFLNISETPRPPIGGKPSYPEDKMEAVTVNGYSGYLVHGGWLSVVQSGATLPPVPDTKNAVWNDTWMAQLWLNIDGWGVNFLVTGTGWTDEMLIQIASSLYEY